MIYRKITCFLLFFLPIPLALTSEFFTKGNPPFISFLPFLSRFTFTAGVLKYWIWRSVLGFCVDYVKCSFYFISWQGVCLLV
ncbi:hypothetical protein BO83DRAFT_238327 [Aspergillus eucalypticola CBS 122712]|uniref:Uncharacterized protein n=1 Tax=Aspergillus eucalypticola (strain CBS 122712 / IBT 29274) TaxID=1448314 RepID=A0A317VT51_ASPEC|nr:uncharacterized protein BO83DRAFT_238327 [Aspergillus eucalypticola CBS 122712]PWY76739.1 hypothetical protein BO83DRAFT_238327 [Aspergillus eucalypticola CBS 122712]